LDIWTTSLGISLRHSSRNVLKLLGIGPPLPSLKIRNPKPEIRNKLQVQIRIAHPKPENGSGCFEIRAFFGHLKLFRISDFDI